MCRLILSEDQKSYKDRAMDLIKRICDRDLDDPSKIDLCDGQTSDAKLHFEKSYARLYDSNNSATGTAHPAPAWSQDQLSRCFDVMASTTVELFWSASRISDVIGREGQGLVFEYLDSVARALRRGFALEDVQPATLKRAREMLEPDTEVMTRRDELLSRKRQLGVIE